MSIPVPMLWVYNLLGNVSSSFVGAECRFREKNLDYLVCAPYQPSSPIGLFLITQFLMAHTILIAIGLYSA